MSRTYGLASVLMEVESKECTFMIGVVGCNYNPTGWDVPFDREKRSVGIRALDGTTFVKGVHQPAARFCRMPMNGSSRCRISLDINMEKLEMRVTCKMAGEAAPGKVGNWDPGEATIVLDGLPNEVAVAVALGPSDETQRVCVLGSSCERIPSRNRRGKEEEDPFGGEAASLHGTPRASKEGSLGGELAAIASTLAQ